MIDPKELMIGNHLYWDYDKKEVEVISVNSTYLWVKMRGGKNEVAYYNDLSPIPITPEILERYGFVKFRDNKDSGFTAYRLLPGTKFNISVYFELGKKEDTEINNTEIDCEHLHQLQNIIQNLTGKPLIK